MKKISICNNRICYAPPIPENHFPHNDIESVIHLKSEQVEEICLSCPEAIIESIDAGDIGFVSQGIFNKNGERIRNELLARVFINKKSISPGIFLPIVERLGFKTAFDYRILEKAFATIHVRKLEGNFSVNINPSTLLNTEKFFKELDRLIRLYEVNTRNITIEILEREEMVDFDALNASIRMLQLLGFSVAIDDYHPLGNNNAYAINKIQGLDMVKFDGAYVSNIFSRNQMDTEKLRKELSSELDTILIQHPESVIVFEYIETLSMFESLSNIDPRIGLFQGYYFDGGNLL